jgi:hypothetical protein
LWLLFFYRRRRFGSHGILPEDKIYAEHRELRPSPKFQNSPEGDAPNSKFPIIRVGKDVCVPIYNVK